MSPDIIRAAGVIGETGPDKFKPWLEEAVHDHVVDGLDRLVTAGWTLTPPALERP